MAFDLLLSDILIQISTAPAAQEAIASASSADSVTIIDLLLKGGLVMIPIGLLSFIAVYLIIERMLVYKKMDKDPSPFLDKIQSLIIQGDLKSARAYCEQTNTPFARMIDRGLSKIGTPLANIEASIENVGKVELYNLEKNLSTLATISGLGPMLGFLGTVTGMVQAFIAMAQEEGTISPKLLSSGIYEAMVTTVGGLIVGIIAYVGYNYLVTKLQKIIHQMEYASVEFLELLQQPK